MMMISGNRNNVGPFGDTTLTKVFVGGLAWETPNDALRDHFYTYGDILEAVIISDKTTGRSKGYGFVCLLLQFLLTNRRFIRSDFSDSANVTFKDPESAKKACEDPAPVINGRRANCNLASLGARRQRSLSVAPPHQNGIVAFTFLKFRLYRTSLHACILSLSNIGFVGPNVNVGPRSAGTVTPPPPPPPPPGHVQWYYPPTPSPFIHRHHHQSTVPYYGYGPATYNVGYNHKIGYMGGAYTHVYPGQAMVGANALVAMYPLHHYNQGAAGGPYYGPVSIPAILSKPKRITPTPVCVAVE
ncbi:Nucleotide-binding, alpha-beta plait [Cynara cardunculus var. scolymus]|uniref:Nucleotide-binding, alpha-beta plait n=1 Tax=Cynara cardunculus var. scolymus TaxID=59895 RepID=A0A118K2W4_CYNCS|nr:Nucleotide-binding, alpha-beta plait [Cynara cardunculus var. scolymus]